MSSRATSSLSFSAAQQVHAPSQQRSSSAPSLELNTQTHPLKKKGIFTGLFNKHNSLSDSGDDCERPLDREPPDRSRRKKSWFKFNELFKFGSHFVKDDHECEGAERARQLNNTPRTSEDTSSLPSLVEEDFTNMRDRPKSSWWQKVQKLISRRRDSVLGSQSRANSQPDPPRHAHSLAELQYYSSALEPFAEEGLLRFQNRSIDQLDPIDGASNFYQKEKYQNRPCKIQPESPFCCRPGTVPQPQVWPPRRVPSIPSSGTASNFDQSRRRRSVEQQSPTPKPKRSARLKSLPFVRDRKARSSPKSLDRGKGKDIDRSESPTAPYHYEPTNFPWSRDTNPFGETPRLRLHTLEDLGVLPSRTSNSIEPSSNVPHANFADDEYSPTTSCTALVQPTFKNSNYNPSPSRHINTDAIAEFAHYYRNNDPSSFTTPPRRRSPSSSLRVLRSASPPHPFLHAANINTSSSSRSALPTLNLPPPQLRSASPSPSPASPSAMPPPPPPTRNNTAINNNNLAITINMPTTTPPPHPLRANPPSPPHTPQPTSLPPSLPHWLASAVESLPARAVSAQSDSDDDDDDDDDDNVFAQEDTYTSENQEQERDHVDSEVSDVELRDISGLRNYVRFAREGDDGEASRGRSRSRKRRRRGGIFYKRRGRYDDDDVFWSS